MNILIGCEESQIICKEFRNHNYNAWSCDLIETRGNKNWHYQDDIINIIPLKKWDLIILHPDCTAIAVSGNRYYAKNSDQYQKRLNAIDWTVALWNLAVKHSVRTALENPVSVIFKYLPNVHYIQPWQFGHGETKKTGFCLNNLPQLKPTNIVSGRKQKVFKMPPGKNRKRDRSQTYKGIAKAIVKQWGDRI